MVSISFESPEQTESRLMRVTTQAKVEIYAESYGFEEFPLEDLITRYSTSALAIVRDDRMWSQLIPTTDAENELFGIFRFHFPSGADNSGFVGWLATRLKTKFGTGVFVTCGHNSADGGIYDYWGVPIELSVAVFDEIRQMQLGTAIPV